MEAQLTSYLPGSPGRVAELVERCHHNQTVYTMLGLEQHYNLSGLKSWRRDVARPEIGRA